MSDVEISGAEDFLRLSKALKHAGRKELRKELNREIKVAAKPIIKKTRARARADLPSGGGLNKIVAKEPQRIQVRTGAKTAGVRIVVGKKRGGARAANKGFIRHPVFGNREVWVTQRVPSDWFDGPARESESELRRSVEKAMQEIVNRIVREAD